jgi:proteasome lid subunit RPN8/RPN11
MILNQYIKDEIKKEALKSVPDECCGLIVDISGSLIVHPCRNISYNKTVHAVLNPMDYVHAAKSGEIVGYYHSHESKGVSFLDNLTAFNHDVYSIVYSWGSDKFYVIEPKLEEYLNVDFKIGENDCLELVKKYYKNRKNIDISSYNRDENWSKQNPNMILENYQKEGFISIDLKDIKEDDIILFNIDNIPSHLAIYVGNDFLLHHPRNNKSVISELTEALKRRICLILRHKNDI